MEVREKYIARLLNEPEASGFTEIKFIHSPQIVTSRWVRLRCQYLCNHKRQSDTVPPFSPSTEEISDILEEYKFGLMFRRQVPIPLQRDHQTLWGEFEQAMVEAENEAFIRGYNKAFATGVGNCLFCHHDDSMRPCDFAGKRRPTLEAVGINLSDTLEMIGWEQHLIRDPEEDFQFFGLLLLE